MAPGETTVHPLPVYPDIIVSLDLLSTKPPRFHWFIYIQAQGSDKGAKYHATRNPVTEIWAYEQVNFALQNSASVAASFIIGKLGTHTQEEFEATIKQIPMQVPDVDLARESKWSCRVWIREALRRLHTAGIIKCPDVDAMEAEMQEHGAAAARLIEDGTFQISKLIKAKNSQ